MSRVVSAISGQSYGLSRVCRVWEIPRSTAYWKRHMSDHTRTTRRPGPLGPCSNERLAEEIKTILSDSPFHGEGYRKLWARLRFKGIRTSKRRALRLMREHRLLAPHRRGSPHGPKAHEGAITTDTVDEMWGTDMSSAWTTEEGQVCIFVAVDHCSSECIGIHAAKHGTRFEALEPIRQGIRNHFGVFREGVASPLRLRHDHGSQYMSDDFQHELRFLGIESSPAFVREPEGNGCAERFIRTLKENLLWIQTFATSEQLRVALREFMDLYNRQWLVERHGNKTPAQVREEQTLLIKRAA